MAREKKHIFPDHFFQKKIIISQKNNDSFSSNYNYLDFSNLTLKSVLLVIKQRQIFTKNVLTVIINVPTVINCLGNYTELCDVKRETTLDLRVEDVIRAAA